MEGFIEILQKAIGLEKDGYEYYLESWIFQKGLERCLILRFSK